MAAQQVTKAHQVAFDGTSRLGRSALPGLLSGTAQHESVFGASGPSGCSKNSIFVLIQYINDRTKRNRRKQRESEVVVMCERVQRHVCFSGCTRSSRAGAGCGSVVG